MQVVANRLLCLRSNCVTNWILCYKSSHWSGYPVICCWSKYPYELSNSFLWFGGHLRRQWHPTPVLSPGKSHGWRSLGGLQSMGSLRVGHDWATSFSLFTFMHWRRKWQPTPVFLPGESQGRGNLVGCRLWVRTESDMTERLHFHFSLSCIGEGNGNPLQCSCLENPRDGGAWWATV